MNEEDNKKHNMYLMQDRNYKKAYEFAISKVDEAYKKNKNHDYNWLTASLNDARFYIDELIENNRFDDAMYFLNSVKENYRNMLGTDVTIENLLEFYEYRILDRKAFSDLQNKSIEKITKEYERKIFEILGFFATFIAIIFGFVNGGEVKVLCYKIPLFILLGITIVLSWWVIKKINIKS